MDALKLVGVSPFNQVTWFSLELLWANFLTNSVLPIPPKPQTNAYLNLLWNVCCNMEMSLSLPAKLSTEGVTLKNIRPLLDVGASELSKVTANEIRELPL